MDGTFCGVPARWAHVACARGSQRPPTHRFGKSPATSHTRSKQQNCGAPASLAGWTATGKLPVRMFEIAPGGALVRALAFECERRHPGVCALRARDHRPPPQKKTGAMDRQQQLNESPALPLSNYEGLHGALQITLMLS